MDDDDDVRVVTDRTLSRAGYQVLAYGSAEAALEQAEQLAAPPDLLVTDVVMPGMRGPELAARLQDRWPELRVLFLSGYVQEGIRSPHPGSAFLPKPYDGPALLGAIRALL